MKQSEEQTGEPNDDPVLTTRAAARLLGVAVSTAQLWMESGAIASWKTPGGHRRCHTSTVLALLKRTSPGAAVQAAPTVDLDEEFLMPADPAYPVPADEVARLAALSSTCLIGSEPEQGYDRITRLAAQLTGCQSAVISLLTAQRQWFKARTGLDAAETPREWAFCSYAILDSEGLVIDDAHADERFRDNPLVTGPPFIRFYAGVPVRDRKGYHLGTLCVFDPTPKHLDEAQLRGLRELAEIVSEAIARRP